MTIDKQNCILNQVIKIEATMQELKDIIFYIEMYINSIIPLVQLFVTFTIHSVILRKIYDVINEKYNHFIDRGIYGN